MSAANDRFKIVPAAYVILRRGDEVLLIRRANTGYFDGYYGLPSGHIDGGEPAHIAAIREAKEEVGITIQPADIRFAHVIHRVAEEGTHERVDFGFVADRWEGEPYNAEPSKCDDLRWCNMNELPENTIGIVVRMLRAAEDGVYYSAENFKVA